MDTIATASPAPVATPEVVFVIRGSAPVRLPSTLASLPRHQVISGSKFPDGFDRHGEEAKQTLARAASTSDVSTPEGDDGRRGAGAAAPQNLLVLLAPSALLGLLALLPLLALLAPIAFLGLLAILTLLIPLGLLALLAPRIFWQLFGMLGGLTHRGTNRAPVRAEQSFPRRFSPFSRPGYSF